MNMLKCCLNWKVLTGLGVAAVGIWIVDPKLIGTALPLLLLAACPLSMLLMMRGMGSMGGMKQAGGSGTYTCPMHPTVQSDQPGRCPHCGMNLVATAPAKQAAPAARTDLSREERLTELTAQLGRMDAQQQQIAQEIARLERGDASDASVVREAELVARTADER